MLILISISRELVSSLYIYIDRERENYSLFKFYLEELLWKNLVLYIHKNLNLFKSYLIYILITQAYIERKIAK